MVSPPTSDSLRSVPPSLFFISLFSTAGCQSGSALKLPITAQTVFADTGSSAVELTLVMAIEPPFALSSLRGREGPADSLDSGARARHPGQQKTDTTPDRGRMSKY